MIRFSSLQTHLSHLCMNTWLAHLSVSLCILYPNVDGNFYGRYDGYTAVSHSLINHNVTHIDLTGNQITTLGDAEFSNYTSLAVLDINIGILSEIHDEAFLHTKIFYLSLRSNLLGEFPNVTAISDTLRSMHLDDNSIEILPPELLWPLVYLTDLRLSENHISEIFLKTFIANQKLEVLSLTGNNINKVPEDAFAGLSLLEELHLGFNNISVFPMKLFENFTALQDLILKDNPFTAWPDLTPVPGIYLDAGLVESYFPPPYTLPSSVCNVKYAIFGHVPNGELPVFDCQENDTSLYSLHLHHRELDDSTDFSRIQTVSASGSLRVLGMRDNSFTTFPSIPHSIREHLFRLEINDCKIERIDLNVLEEYNMLTVLDLSNNKLVTLPTRLFTVANTLHLGYMKSLDYNQSVWDEYLCEASDGKLSNLHLDESMDRIQQFPHVSHLVCNAGSI